MVINRLGLVQGNPVNGCQMIPWVHLPIDAEGFATVNYGRNDSRNDGGLTKSMNGWTPLKDGGIEGAWGKGMIEVGARA